MVDLLLSNYEEASYVANNLIKAKRSIQEQVRQAVMQKLAVALQDDFVIHRGAPIENRYAQVWIKYKAYPDSKLYFGVESFNGDGNFNGDLFVGVFNDGGHENSYTRERATDKLRWWYDERFFETGGSRVNLGIPALILKLHATPSFKEELIDLIVTETIAFVTEHKAQLLRHLQ